MDDAPRDFSQDQAGGQSDPYFDGRREERDELDEGNELDLGLLFREPTTISNRNPPLEAKKIAEPLSEREIDKLIQETTGK